MQPSLPYPNRFASVAALRVFVGIVLLASFAPAMSLHASALTMATGPLQEYLFTEGRQNLNAGDVERAVEVWRTVLPDRVLGPPASLLTAGAYMASGNPQLAERVLNDLLKTHQAGPYDEFAKSILVTALYEQGKPEGLNMLRAMLEKAPEKDKPGLLLRTARLENRLGEVDKAAGHYRTLFLSHPASVEGLKAGDELAWLVRHEKIKPPEFSEKEQLDRAERLFNKGRFDLAADAYQVLLKAQPQDIGLLLKLGRCRFKDRRNQNAIEILNTVLKGQVTDAQRFEALHLLSLTYWRLDREKDFEQCTARIVEKGPDKLKRKALFNLGAFLTERGKYAPAEEAFNKLLKMNPDTSMKADVKWKLAWLKYRQKKFKEAADAFKECRVLSAGSRLDKPARYWQARSLASAGQTAESEALLGELAASNSLDYYGIEAARLLKDKGGASAKEKTSGTKEKKAGAAFPGIQLSAVESSHELVKAARKLMELDLPEFALLNLEALPRSMRSSPALAFLTAQAAHSAEKYRRAHEILASAFGPFMENPPADAPSEFIELAFPRVHLSETRRLAEKHALDPHLVWAVIRQESRYDAGVVSPAGALGLMQVTPEAAGLTRRKGAISASGIAEIMEPKTNISHGIRILAKNVESFKGKLVPAVAAYNADIRKVREWVKRNGKMPQDEFIESIPYLETRIYVKKVLAGYRAYSLLHRNKDLSGLW